MRASNEELQNVRTFQAVTAWIFAIGIAVVSGSVTIALHAI